MKRVNKISSFITKTINEELKNCEIYKNIRGRGFALAVEHDTKNNIEFSKELKRKMLSDHKILMNIKFHRTSMTPSFNMKMKNIENSLEIFIKNFKKLSKNMLKIRKKRILIFGSEGSIGRDLVKYLSQTYLITKIDLFKNKKAKFNIDLTKNSKII